MGGENARKYSRLQPGAKDDQRRIEVRVETDDDGRRQVVLEDLSYGPGIGWYVQKTIRLDPYAEKPKKQRGIGSITNK